METYIIFIILILVVVTATLIYVASRHDYFAVNDGITNILKNTIGGANKRKQLINENKHIVVDGLNLLYHHFSTTGIQKSDDIIPKIKTMMKSIVPKLKNKFNGRVMFVFKNKENIPYSDGQKAEYKKIAVTHNICIYLCQDYPDSKYPSHSSMGRDDFYGSILARLYKCRILSYDRYYDFENFVRDVKSFHVYIIDPILLGPIKLINIDASDYKDEIKRPYTFTLETV